MNGFRRGEIVVITGLDLTRENYGVNYEMRELFRNRDEMVVLEVSGNSVSASGWSWHYQDLVYAKPITLENE